jgi:hypothetical protein
VAKSITIDEAPEWVMHLREELRKASIRGLQSAALRLQQHIVAEVIPNTKDERTGKGPPVDKGAYRAAWRVRNVSNGAIVSNTLPYASIIEYGARADNIAISRPMILALTDWVMRKGLVGKRPGKNGDRVEFYRQAQSIAWAIAVSMKKMGIYNQGKGLRVLERALKQLPKIVDEEVTRELRRVE